MTLSWLRTSVKQVALVGLAMLLPAGAAVAQDAVAEDSGPSFEAGLDYSSLYVFRGVNILGQDQDMWVPRAKVTVGGFSAWGYGYLGKFDTFDASGARAGENDYLEVDLGADYTFELDAVSVTLGALTYRYSDEVRDGLGFLDTYEVYGIASWDVPLAPTVSYYHDVDAIDGGYLSIGVSHSFPLGDRASLDLSGALGIDNQYNSDQSFEPNDVLLGVKLPVSFSDTVSAYLLVQQSIALSALDELEQDDETIVTAGVTVSF